MPNLLVVVLVTLFCGLGGILLVCGFVGPTHHLGHGHDLGARLVPVASLVTY